jgi:hypothetical protein
MGSQDDGAVAVRSKTLILSGRLAAGSTAIKRAMPTINERAPLDG